MQKHSVQCNNVQCSIFSVDSLINQTMMAQRCVLHIFFNQKCFALVRGYLAEKIFYRGYITEKMLRTTAIGDGRKGRQWGGGVHLWGRGVVTNMHSGAGTSVGRELLSSQNGGPWDKTS